MVLWHPDIAKWEIYLPVRPITKDQSGLKYTDVCGFCCVQDLLPGASLDVKLKTALGETDFRLRDGVPSTMPWFLHPDGSKGQKLGQKPKWQHLSGYYPLGDRITLWFLWGFIVIDGPNPGSARHWSDLASAPSLLPATISLEQWFKKDHIWVYAHPKMLRIRAWPLGKRTVSWMKLQPQISWAQT